MRVVADIAASLVLGYLVGTAALWVYRGLSLLWGVL